MSKEMPAEIFSGNEWVLPTDIQLVEKAEENFQERLARANWSEDESYPLGLAFREALINAIAHGNLEVESDPETNIMTLALKKQEQNPTDKKIYISIDATPERVSVTIKDEGKGFDWKSLADPTNPEALLKAFGRGNLFMKAFDSVTRNEAGNEVTMIKSKEVN